MTPTQQVRINELLLERERLFAHVAELEEQILKIVPLPLKYPEELPSSPQRRKKKKKTTAKKKKVFRMPKLQEGEKAYRVTLKTESTTWSENHIDPIPIEQVLHSPIQDRQIIAIDTIDLSDTILSRIWDIQQEE